MSKRLILFSIAGIQEFIINSKRVQDLCNSSEILSSLIRLGINHIKTHYQGTLILPKIDNENNPPNYFFMEFQCDKDKDIKIDEFMKAKYISMLTESNIFKQCLKSFDQSEDIKKYLINQIKNQVNSSLEIYWVEKILENDLYIKNTTEYKKIYKQMYEYFDASKNVRKFTSLNEEGEKCSVCGIRNGIFKGKLKKDSRMQKQYSYNNMVNSSLHDLIDTLQKNNVKINPKIINDIKNKAQIMYFQCDQLGDKEVLCAPCMLKRIFHMTQSKELALTDELNEVAISCNYIDESRELSDRKNISLAHITLSRWIQLEQESDREQYEDYKKKLNKVIKNNDKNIDIYESMYNENWNKILKDIHVNNIKEIIDDLTKKIERLKYQKLPKYYCVYRMDIDNLGKWMSGKNLSNDDELYNYQQKLSNNINKFFSEIRNLFSENQIYGKLVYAGGDDLLAIIPVNDMFKLYYSIENKFKKYVQESQEKNYDYNDITYSTGMFIAHYKTPLGEILRVSKESIEMVKNKFKYRVNDSDKPKDGVVISIMTEGYDNRSVYFKNKHEEELNMDLFVNIMRLFCKGNIENIIKCGSDINTDPIFNNTKLSYFHDQLQTEFMDIEKNIDYEDEINDVIEMISIEQKRLMLRSLEEGNIDKAMKEKCSDINDNMIKFINNNCRRRGILDLNNYFNLFHIVRALNMYMVVVKDD